MSSYYTHTKSEISVHPQAVVCDARTNISPESGDNHPAKIQVHLKHIIRGVGDTSHFQHAEITMTASQWREVTKAVSLLIAHESLVDEDGYLCLMTVNEAIEQAKVVTEIAAQAQYDSEREDYITQGISLS